MTEFFIKYFSYSLSLKFLHSCLLLWKTSTSMFEKESAMLNFKIEDPNLLSLSDNTRIQ